MTLVAQQPTTGSISGIVRDSSAGGPLPGVHVSVAGQDTAADSQGRFTFEQVAPGSQWVSASEPSRGAYGGVYVLVSVGKEATAKIALEPGGVITGRVVDEDRKPVSGVVVTLLSRRYHYTELVYAPSQTLVTNQEGEYRFEGVSPGQSFLILAKKPLRAIDVKDKPAPEEREAVPQPTFYGNSRDIRGAQAVRVMPGQARAGVDIRMPAAPSYCIEGAIEGGGDAKKVFVNLTERLAFDTGWALAPTTVAASATREFRACGLHPGGYHLWASSAVPEKGSMEYNSDGQTLAEGLFASADATIIDRDVRDLKLVGRPAMRISGEMKCDAPPKPPVEVEIRMVRYAHGDGAYADSPHPGALGGGAFMLTASGARIPGPFNLGRWEPGDWEFRLSRLPASCYLKEATYGTENVLHGSLHLAQAAGTERLLLEIGCDAGVLSARVRDKDGNPVSGVILYVMSADAESEGALASSLRRVQVVGGWSAPLSGLPPGKYLALVADTDFDPQYAPADQIEELWRAKSNATEVEIGPGASAQITVEPVKLD